MPRSRLIAEIATGPPKLESPERIQSPWMSPTETAQYIGVALGTLRNWTSAKYVPHVKRGRVVRSHRDAIDRWLSQKQCLGRATLPMDLKKLRSRNSTSLK